MWISVVRVLELSADGRQGIILIGRQSASRWGCAKSLQLCHLPWTITAQRIVPAPKNIQKRAAIMFQDPSTAQLCTILFNWNVWQRESKSKDKREEP